MSTFNYSFDPIVPNGDWNISSPVVEESEEEFEEFELEDDDED
jgi:hypothetical protein